MKIFNFKKSIAHILFVLSILLANTSSSVCISILFKEPKMPKSLYKFD